MLPPQPSFLLAVPFHLISGGRSVSSPQTTRFKLPTFIPSQSFTFFLLLFPIKTLWGNHIGGKKNKRGGKTLEKHQLASPLTSPKHVFTQRSPFQQAGLETPRSAEVSGRSKSWGGGWGVNPTGNFRSSPHNAGPRAASATSCGWRGGVWAGFVPFCNRDLQRRGSAAGVRDFPKVIPRREQGRGRGRGWGRHPRAESLQGKARKAAAPRGPAGAAGSTTTSPVSLVPFFLPLDHAAEAAADFPRGSPPPSEAFGRNPKGVISAASPK